MSVIFFEGKRVPEHVRNQFGSYYVTDRSPAFTTNRRGALVMLEPTGNVPFAGFGDDAGTQIANIVSAASPWNLLKGIFVDKPAAQAQAQAEIAQAQAIAAGEASQAQQATIHTALMLGAGVIGLLALVSVLRRPRAVGGYRRKSRRSRSRK